MKQILILAVVVLLTGCSDSPERQATLMEATFDSMDSCLSKLKSTANQPFRVITDKPEEVSGFYGEQDFLFACQREESGTQGVYFKGMIEVPR